jgi:hypothetical protein
MRLLLAITFLFASLLAVAEESQSNSTSTATTNPSAAEAVEKKDPLENSYYILCKNKNIVRTVRIEKKGSACTVYYAKEGVDKVVGKSGTEAICREVFNKIKNNLEKGGEWKCRDITHSRVSFSNFDQ